MKKQPITKVTEFKGYISGDYESFCLCTVPFERWTKNGMRGKQLYPANFFPEEAEGKKCRFKITIEAYPLAINVKDFTSEVRKNDTL